jgi:putative ABC transport system substrate-binding protein
MRRRTLLLRGFDFGIALGLTALPMAVRGQAPPQAIGFLRSTGAVGYDDIVDAFRKGLADAGLVEGRDVVIEFRWADNRPERLPVMAADLVGRRVAVIVTNAGAARAVKVATTAIPIVFVSGEDPIRMGLVTNLARPSGNLTGVAFLDTDLAAKRLGLLHELVARSAAIAVLIDPNSPGGVRELKGTEEAGRAMGRQLIIAKASSDAEIDAAFLTFGRASAGAVFIGAGPYFGSRREIIATRVARSGLPAVAALRSFAEAGVLASYGPSFPDAYRRAGDYVARILKGAKPADLPVELPTKYELVINLKTAKALGLAIPQTILLRADNVIQ